MIYSISHNFSTAPNDDDDDECLGNRYANNSWLHCRWHYARLCWPYSQPPQHRNQCFCFYFSLNLHCTTFFLFFAYLMLYARCGSGKLFYQDCAHKLSNSEAGKLIPFNRFVLSINGGGRRASLTV